VADLRDLSADIVFIGCDGLTVETGLTTPHVLVAEVAATMASRSRRVVTVADSSKLGRRGFTPIAPLSAVDVLVTDEEADAAELARIRSAGIQVILA
jgi:DeoR/GlpR family transcriptional regulator of sugar metabolism